MTYNYAQNQLGDQGFRIVFFLDSISRDVIWRLEPSIVFPFLITFPLGTPDICLCVWISVFRLMYFVEVAQSLKQWGMTFAKTIQLLLLACRLFITKEATLVSKSLIQKNVSDGVCFPITLTRTQIGRLQVTTSQSISELQAPSGPGGRSAQSFSNASNPLQILYKTEHFEDSDASWLRTPLLQILFKCFKSFTNPL